MLNRSNPILGGDAQGARVSSSLSLLLFHDENFASGNEAFLDRIVVARKGRNEGISFDETRVFVPLGPML